MGKMKICKWDKFNDINEDRITNISISEFFSLLKKTHNNIFLYKQIYNPTFICGYFNKSFKNNIDDYLNLSILEKTDISYPKRNYSLVCSPKNDEEIGTSFLVFPYKESLFTIKENDNYYKGYWRDKIKWMDKIQDNELWTEDECLLIQKSVWDIYKK